MTELWMLCGLFAWVWFLELFYGSGEYLDFVYGVSEL